MSLSDDDRNAIAGLERWKEGEGDDGNLATFGHATNAKGLHMVLLSLTVPMPGGPAVTIGARGVADTLEGAANAAMRDMERALGPYDDQARCLETTGEVLSVN